MIYKVIPDEPYGIIPSQLLQSALISSGARHSMHCMLSHMAGYAGFSMGQLCDQMDIDRRTAQRHIKELKAWGFLKVEEQFSGKGTQLVNAYTVYGKSLVFPSWVFRITTRKLGEMSMGEYRKRLLESGGDVSKFPMTEAEIKGKITDINVGDERHECHPTRAACVPHLNKSNSKDGSLPSPPVVQSSPTLAVLGPASPSQGSLSCARRTTLPSITEVKKPTMTHAYRETVEILQFLEQEHGFLVKGHLVNKWVNKAILRGGLTIEKARELHSQGKDLCNLTRYDLQKYLANFAENYDRIVATVT